MATLQVELAVSNMDLYPVDFPGSASWRSTIEQLDTYLSDTGFSSMEIHPTRQLHREALAMREGFEAVVGSQHQTFNEGTGIVGLAGRIAGLYTTDESYSVMLDIDKEYGQKPMVVYPSQILQNAIKNLGTPGDSPLIIQPTPEVYRDYDVSSSSMLLKKMSSIGIGGLCLDTVHSRRKAADGFESPNVETTWAEQCASGKVYQMHIALDRLDITYADADMAQKSHQEFEAFLASWRAGLRTQAGDMIAEAVRAWKKPADLAAPILRMVVEVPPLPKEILRRKKQHTILCQNVAEMLSHLGVEPLTRDF